VTEAAASSRLADSCKLTAESFVQLSYEVKSVFTRGVASL